MSSSKQILCFFGLQNWRLWDEKNSDPLSLRRSSVMLWYPVNEVARKIAMHASQCFCFQKYSTHVPHEVFSLRHQLGNVLASKLGHRVLQHRLIKVGALRTVVNFIRNDDQKFTQTRQVGAIGRVLENLNDLEMQSTGMYGQRVCLVIHYDHIGRLYKTKVRGHSQPRSTWRSDSCASPTNYQCECSRVFKQRTYTTQWWYQQQAYLKRSSLLDNRIHVLWSSKIRCVQCERIFKSTSGVKDRHMEF